MRDQKFIIPRPNVRDRDIKKVGVVKRVGVVERVNVVRSVIAHRRRHQASASRRPNFVICPPRGREVA